MLVIMEGKQWSKLKFSGKSKNPETFSPKEEKYVALTINQADTENTVLTFLKKNNISFFNKGLCFYL